MDDESHRDEMNAAIRAQRQRGNVPKSMLPPEDESLPGRPPGPAEPPVAAEPAAPRRTLLERLLGR